ncbi:hypothetical protein Ga0074812_14330 [Parafrankia irregularis]|uniref:Resolvase, N terminal domain n=1 Tax=Parafrankia irregularis TaxID=795642 RepID=A0A0S4QYG4_9ACTN|nr:MULTISPECIES: hypothetical protein [Frankiaceae]KPM53150.1 hypothetical protein ACG83_27725 [Frankia sp. R43]MBE3204675.1 hypothetical protein [Parafrankia sp. CH37]CUU60613.1 hypothetical protein Ga0074812_14330 [Parafrankia irregularis]
MPQTFYGYISLESDDETEIERLHDLLTAHAQAEGLTLSEILVDRNTPPGRIIRAGLTVILDALLRTEGCGVLIAGPHQFSSIPAVRRTIQREIESLGATVLVIPGTQTTQRFPLPNPA